MKAGFLVTAALALAAALPAIAAETWNGTWFGGFDSGGNGVQITFVGDELIGFFFDGDYLDVRASYSGSDGVVTVTWSRGRAILTRDGPTAAHLLVQRRDTADITLRVMPDH